MAVGDKFEVTGEAIDILFFSLGMDRQTDTDL